LPEDEGEVNPDIAAVLAGERQWCVVTGDCRDILPTLPDKSVDAVVTDPPYGHNNNDGTDLIGRIGLFRGKEYVAGSTSEGRPIANDGAEANELARWSFGEMYRLLKPGCCCCCCCGGGGPDPQFARWSLWLDEAFKGGFKQMVIWDKGPMGMGWHYRRSYETVLVAQKPGAACAWYDESAKIENIIRPGQWGIRKIIPDADQHPTEKPPELAAHFVRLHSRGDEVVCDPFTGHGFTGVAAVQLGRRFIGVEIDPGYAKMATERIDRAARQGRLAL
jgi:site-specific DNA-methyltransferase (adenine-specific)